MPRGAALVLMLAALTACHSGPNLDDLKRARATWAGQNVRDYEITIRRLCLCPSTEPVRVRVVAGQVVSQTVVPTRLPLDSTQATMYPAVPGLFELVEGAYQRADRATATFNRQYGYPESIRIDWIAKAIDDELTVEVSDFSPSKPLQ